MDEELIKLKCRNCGSVIVLTNKNGNVECNCGKCVLEYRNKKIYIGSETGIGGYIIIKGDAEYVLVKKEEL